jgi:hypothetical protein
MPSSRRSRLAAGLVPALAAGALVAPGAVAAPVQKVALTGGSTTLKLAPGTAKALDDLRVTVGLVKPARAAQAGPAFPIVGGRVDATSMAGRIRHSGGLKLSAGGTTVRATRYTIRIKKRPDLTARIGSARVRLLALDLSKAKITKHGNRVKVARVKAFLTRPAAKALNAAFDVTAFKAGLRVGTATVRARVG